MDLFIKSLWNEKALASAYFTHTHKHSHTTKKNNVGPEILPVETLTVAEIPKSYTTFNQK